jgi:hypothetical protein
MREMSCCRRESIPSSVVGQPIARSPYRPTYLSVILFAKNIILIQFPALLATEKVACGFSDL